MSWVGVSRASAAGDRLGRSPNLLALGGGWSVASLGCSCPCHGGLPRSPGTGRSKGILCIGQVWVLLSLQWLLGLFVPHGAPSPSGPRGWSIPVALSWQQSQGVTLPAAALLCSKRELLAPAEGRCEARGPSCCRLCTATAPRPVLPQELVQLVGLGEAGEVGSGLGRWGAAPGLEQEL